MVSYGAGIPHFLIIMLVGFLWILVLAVVAALLFLVIRFAVLSAHKAHTRWVDAGKPDGSAWSQRPAPHPGFATDAAPAAPTPLPEPEPTRPETPGSASALSGEGVGSEGPSTPPTPRKAPAKHRTPRPPKQP